MPLHLERESHQNCRQDPVGLKFLKCAPYFVSWIEGTSCTLLSQPTRPVLSLHHSHHKFPTFTATLHSLTTPHTPQYSYFSPHNTLSTPHSLATHSPLSHHTFLILTPHNPHPLTTPISQHTLPSVTTNSYILFLTTLHSLYSLDAPHTSNFHIKTLSHHSLPLSFHTTHSPLSHFTLPTFSPHILHFLAAHSPLSYHSLIPLPTLSPYHTIPTVSPHTPISHLTSYFRTSLISHLTPHSLTTLPTILLHFILSYKSQISFPTLEPHFATAHSHFHYALHSFTTLPHFSLYSSLSSYLISSPISHSRLSYLTPYTLSPPPLSPGRTLRWEMGVWSVSTVYRENIRPRFIFPFACVVSGQI